MCRSLQDMVSASTTKHYWRPSRSPTGGHFVPWAIQHSREARIMKVSLRRFHQRHLYYQPRTSQVDNTTNGISRSLTRFITNNCNHHLWLIWKEDFLKDDQIESAVRSRVTHYRIEHGEMDDFHTVLAPSHYRHHHLPCAPLLNSRASYPRYWTIKTLWCGGHQSFAAQFRCHSSPSLTCFT